MSDAPDPPPPIHILRGHNAPLSSLYISDDNERLYSGDSSGYAICTYTRSLRPLALWKAHDDGFLGIEEYGRDIITQGRDNKLHVWERMEELTKIGGSAALADLPKPTLKYSLDVNALNYCRFSLLRVENAPVKVMGEDTFLIALPNLVESFEADIWSLPSCQRLHAAIGKTKGKAPAISADGRGDAVNGIIMAIHLFAIGHLLRTLIAYEDGTVILRSSDRTKSVEGEGWDVLWTVKLHVEAIMAMTVSRDNSVALTVSADHLVGKYNLLTAQYEKFRIKQPGNASVSIRDDGKVCAVGGWDGRIRLFSTKNFKALGTLKYHKMSCHVVLFARKHPSRVDDADSDELDEDEREERTRWLISGAKDKLISIWSLISFQKAGSTE